MTKYKIDLYLNRCISIIPLYNQMLVAQWFYSLRSGKMFVRKRNDGMEYESRAECLKIDRKNNNRNVKDII